MREAGHISKEKPPWFPITVLHMTLPVLKKTWSIYTFSRRVPLDWVLSCFSCVQFFVSLWTTAHQAPLSMGFSRQEYWSGLSCPPPGDLPDSGIKLEYPMSPASQVDSLLLSHQGNPSYWLVISKHLNLTPENVTSFLTAFTSSMYSTLNVIQDF